MDKVLHNVSAKLSPSWDFMGLQGTSWVSRRLKIDVINYVLTLLLNVVPLIDMPVGSLITTTLTVWVFAMLLNIWCLNIGLSVMATVQFHSLLNF